MFKKNKYFKFLFGFIVFAFSFLEGSDIIDRRFNISIESNTILIILLIALIIGLIYTYYENKSDKNTEKIKDNTTPNNSNYASYLNICLSLLIIILFYFYFNKGKSNKEILEKILPSIHTAYEDGNIEFVFTETKKILEKSPENTLIESYYNKVTTSVSIYSSPSNTDLYFKFPRDTTNNWIYLGKTPLENIKVPQKFIRLKFLHNEQEFFTGTHPYYLNDNDNLFILPKEKIEANEKYKLFLGRNLRLRFPGIDHLPNVKIRPYQIAKNEVSNIEYQDFVNDGGYKNPEYWDFPITIEGNIYTFEETVKKFTGEYGKAGPSNWNYSNFPKGQDEYPVTGISWFEARAYAKYRGMDIPNVYQWSHAANMGISNRFVPKSNFSKNQLTNVGNQETDNQNGLYDIAGNVREWTINISNESQTNRAILGGCYLDDDYFFNDYYGQNIFERSVGNGVRLVKNLDCDIELTNKSNEAVFIQTRDFYTMPKISDEVFEIYNYQYLDYNNDLTATTSEALTEGDYKIQRYEIPSVDGNGILPGYIFYNSNIEPPYKPIIYFPGSNAIHLTNTEIMLKNNIERFNYLMEEGYAIVHPIYLSTYEKADDLKSDYPEKTKKYKEHIITWGKEFKKTLDYIESRNDLNDKVSFYGVSWGGYMANILLAIDDRVKAAVLNVAGLCFQETYKEVEAYVYTPRIKCPVIMLNGKYDVFFPLETSQKPMFDLLGTKEEDKKHYVYPSGHYVPKKELINQHLNWLNKYLK